MVKRILIVDDDADVRLTVRTILSSAGYEVLEASTGEEARQRLQTERVDLAVLDVMMDTDTDGLHLAYHIRSQKKLQDLPIILFTCIEEKTGLAFDLQSSGDYLPAQAFLRKPVEPEELKREVARLLA